MVAGIKRAYQRSTLVKRDQLAAIAAGKIFCSRFASAAGSRSQAAFVDYLAESLNT